MILTYIKAFFILMVLTVSSLSAQTIDISQDKPLLLLKESAVYISNENKDLDDVITENLFQPYHKEYINTAMNDHTIWVQFTLENRSNHPVEKVLILTSPLLEHIALYKENRGSTPQLKGVRHIIEEHHTLHPYYTITLNAHSAARYILEVKSELTPVDFRLKLDSAKNFFREDQQRQLINIFLIGFVFALGVYSFVLFFYTRDKSYLFYSFYLLVLIWQQITYLGLTQIYFPLPFIAFDMQIPAFKVNILILSSALFAIYFLKTEKFPLLNRIYWGFILIALISIAMLSFSFFHPLYLATILGTFFIIFNLSAGIIAYMKGQKQARLFILGFGIVFFSYLLIILDAVGITSLMQRFSNILMYTTAFEALVLSLAFADRYMILQKEKERVDRRILDESQRRTELVETEVHAKTEALNKALQMKDFLLQEVHHRVKNNLQIILSMIRLQNDEIDDKKISEKFLNLENRINAISQTYNMLLIKDDLEEIDMQEYIETLLLDLDTTLNYDQQVSIETQIDAQIPLRESVYIGLIVNELVTNAYKYAFDDKGIIRISLQHDNNDFILIIEDNGKGFNLDQHHQTLGLKLVHTLVYDQLGGTMEVQNQKQTKYTIRFTL